MTTREKTDTALKNVCTAKCPSSFSGVRLENSTLLAQSDVLKAHAGNVLKA